MFGELLIQEFMKCIIILSSSKQRAWLFLHDSLTLQLEIMGTVWLYIKVQGSK
jgi:hypothetical protein